MGTPYTLDILMLFWTKIHSRITVVNAQQREAQIAAETHDAFHCLNLFRHTTSRSEVLNVGCCHFL